MLQQIGHKRMVLGCVAFGAWIWILTAGMLAAVLSGGSQPVTIVITAVISGVTAGVFGFLGVLISSKDDEAEPNAAQNDTEGRKHG